MPYNKINWKDKQAPFLEAKNLNRMEAGIEYASNGIDYLKPIVTDNTNKITAISTGENHKGVWTPTSSTEYPTAPVKGDSWYIGNLTNPYTFTGGDLNGKMANNQDKIVYSGTAWSLIEKLHIPDEVVLRIPTINDFGTVDNTKYPTVIVEDEARGGIFVYDANAGTDDGGLIFSKWKRRYDNYVDIKWFDVKGDGVADDSDGINKALSLDLGKYYFPKGTYNITKEILIKSNTTIIGDNAVIKGSDTMSPELNIITNYNWGKKIDEHAYDENINIIDMTIDGNCFKRAVGHTDNELDTIGGCGIKMVSVKNSNIKNTKVYRGIMHCIDISVYELAGNNVSVGHLGHDHYVNPPKNIVIDGCRTEDSFIDDGITTHFLKNGTINNCVSIRTNTEYSKLRDNQNGFEIDDGSENVVVSNCYSEGYVKGYSIVGHYDSPPARNITFIQCVANKVGFGFYCWNNPGNSTVGNQNYIPPEDRIEKSAARDILFQDCKVTNMRKNTSSSILYPFGILGYVNVKLLNISIDGMEANTGTTIEFNLKGYGTYLDSVDIKNIDDNGGSDIYWGLFPSRVDNTWRPYDINIKNVTVDKLTTYKYLINDQSGSVTSVKNVVIGHGENLTAIFYTDKTTSIGKELSTSIQNCIALNDKTIINKIKTDKGTRNYKPTETIISNGINVSGVTKGQGTIYSERYTPIITGESNCSVTTNETSYIRVGRTIFVAGIVEITGTADGEISFNMGLPDVSPLININGVGVGSGTFNATLPSVDFQKGTIYPYSQDDNMKFFGVLNGDNGNSKNYTFLFQVECYL